MHWIEHLVYFSSAPLIALFSPPWIFRVAILALIIFPLEVRTDHNSSLTDHSHYVPNNSQGHCGFGWKENESSSFHYIHHAKFNWNYGTSPHWDKLLGTNFKGKI